MKTTVKNKKKLKRVLLIEDDKDLNEAFFQLLSREGYAVTQTYNGREALERVSDCNPEIILLDLLMPVMDGKQFLRNYKNEDNVPVIVFSNLDSVSSVSEVLELGATHYMLKAWTTTDELFKVINDVL